MHGCGSLPFASDGNPHTPLPRRLVHFGPVAGGFDIAHDPPPQPLRLPGSQGQLCQERTVTQPTSIVPGYSYRLGADDRYCLSGASHLDSATRSFLQGRHRPSSQNFPEDAGPYGSGFAGTSAGSALYATHPVLVKTAAAWSQGRHRVTVTQACVSALTRWRNPLWLKRGVTLDTAHRRKDVTTDASNKGWGALCENSLNCK